MHPGLYPHACMHTCTYTQVHTHTHMHVHTHTHKHRGTDTYTHIHVQTNTHIYAHNKYNYNKLNYRTVKSFGELQQFAMFFANFHYFHNIPYVNGLLIWQSFFHQTSYSPYSPNFYRQSLLLYGTTDTKSYLTS